MDSLPRRMMLRIDSLCRANARRADTKEETAAVGPAVAMQAPKPGPRKRRRSAAIEAPVERTRTRADRSAGDAVEARCPPALSWIRSEGSQSVLYWTPSLPELAK